VPEQAPGGPPEGPPAPGAPPGVPGGEQPPAQQPQPEIKVESSNVFTLIGEVVIGDIKNAFNDFKDFIDRLSKLDFIQTVEIKSCEVNQEKNKIDFIVVLNLK